MKKVKSDFFTYFPYARGIFKSKTHLCLYHTWVAHVTDCDFENLKKKMKLCGVVWIERSIRFTFQSLLKSSQISSNSLHLTTWRSCKLQFYYFFEWELRWHNLCFQKVPVVVAMDLSEKLGN